MASCGFKHEQIAECLGTDGINDVTLRKHFRRELTTSMSEANAKVGAVCFKRALKGEAWAVCFWLKCRAGWKETQRTEVSGPDGKPIETADVSAAELLRSRIASIAERDEPGSTPTLVNGHASS